MREGSEAKKRSRGGGRKNCGKKMERASAHEGRE